MLSFTITLRNQSTKTIKTLFNIKTSKRIILLAAFVVLTLTSQAQRFEWAKTIDGYDQSSSNIANKIVGSMTDHDGNIYFCSTAKSPLVGEILLKYSPDGTLLWVHQPQVREEWAAYPYTLESRSSTYYSLLMLGH